MVVLVQHGRAKSEQEDPARPLTEEGKKETEKIAKFIARFFKADIIYHSGKKRAEETAFELARYIGGEVKRTEGIAPLDPPDQAVKIIEREGVEKNVVIVGHLPNLSRVVEKLCGADCVKFIYSGAVCLAKDEDGKWKVLWYVRPDMLK